MTGKKFTLILALMMATSALTALPGASDSSPTPGVFGQTPRPLPLYNGQVSTAISADFNGDGLIDVVRVGQCNGPQHHVFIATGFDAWEHTQTFDDGYCVAQSAVHDFDSDGDLDILYALYSNGGPLRVVFNDGTGQFSYGPTLDANGWFDKVIDYNFDGHLDIARRTGSGFEVLFGDGTGGFPTRIAPQMGVSGNTNTVSFADLDQDGDMDALYGRMYTGNPASAYLNDGNDVFTLSSNFGSGMEQITPADFNGDGYPDIVAAHRHNQGQPGDVWFGNGDGTFTHGQDLFAGFMWDTIAADLDNDGDLDILYGSFGTRVFFNDGAGNFGPMYQVDSTGDQSNGLSLVDFDGDGFLDIGMRDAYFLNNWNDADGDGIPDSMDPDSDNDGVLDEDDAFPTDPTEWLDTDGDGIGNNADSDDDNDGVLDADDAFPLDPTEWLDTDGDGIGNNADPDDDNDGVLDADDAFPLDPTEWLDTDGDGIGNNADPDDDNDGLLDVDEVIYGSDPLVRDSDLDGLEDGPEVHTYGTNPVLADTDGEGLSDGEEVLVYGTDPLQRDTDGDLYSDATEVSCGSDPLDGFSIPLPTCALPDEIVVPVVS